MVLNERCGRVFGVVRPRRNSKEHMKIVAGIVSLKKPVTCQASRICGGSYQNLDYYYAKCFLVAKTSPSLLNR